MLWVVINPCTLQVQAVSSTGVQKILSGSSSPYKKGNFRHWGCSVVVKLSNSDTRQCKYANPSSADYRHYDLEQVSYCLKFAVSSPIKWAE